MSLYLVQHGHSLAEEVDPDRPLTDEGKSTVEENAKRAASCDVHVSQIRHSGKTRTRQTAEILAAHLKPSGGVLQMQGLKPKDDVRPIAEKITAEENLLLVGHLPFMERLASYLITGDIEPITIKFQYGGIVCLDQDPDKGNWFLKWTLFADID